MSCDESSSSVSLMSGFGVFSVTISREMSVGTRTKPVTTDAFSSATSNFPLPFWTATVNCKLPVKKYLSIKNVIIY
jgi:hypothetical protein